MVEKEIVTRNKIKRIRVTEEEDRLIKTLAELKGLNESEFLRYLIRKEENEIKKRF